MGYAISDRVEAVAKRLAGGIPGDDGVFVRRAPYQHFLAYPAAGQLNFEFFNASRSRYITNLPHQGTISSNTAFCLQVVRCYPITGLGTDGARNASGAMASATALTPVTVAEEVRTTIMANAEVTFEVNNRLIFNVIGLHKFAAGGGASIDGAIGLSTGLAAIANVNNGVPIAQNGYEMLPGPFPIMPGQQIRLTVDFRSLLTWQDEGMLGMELDGLLLSEASAS